MYFTVSHLYSTDRYLQFPARGRKLSNEHQRKAAINLIDTYNSPQGDGNKVTGVWGETESIRDRYLQFPARGRKFSELKNQPFG